MIRAVPMTTLRRSVMTFLTVGIFGVSVAAKAEQAPSHEVHGPHHLSVLAGGTTISAVDETATTLGIDYEYRVSDFVGLGVVAERAFGRIDSTTLLAVADLHLAKGLVVQTGPGIEFIDGEENFVARIGALYEFELGGGLTFSPQFHYDISKEDAVVFGAAIGLSF